MPLTMECIRHEGLCGRSETAGGRWWYPGGMAPSAWPQSWSMPYQRENHGRTGQRCGVPRQFCRALYTEAMPHRVPWTCSRRHVAHRDRHSHLIGEQLSFPCPYVDTRAMVASTIRAEHKACGLRIVLLMEGEDTGHCDADVIISGSWGMLNEVIDLIDDDKRTGGLTETGGQADELSDFRSPPAPAF